MSGKFVGLGHGETKDQDRLWRAIQQFVGSANGQAEWGKLWSLTSLSDNANYHVTVKNNGTGGHLNVPNEVQVKSDGSGTVIRALSVSGALAVGSLHVTGNALVDGTLGARATTVTALTATGNVILGDTPASDTLVVNAALTQNGTSLLKATTTLQNSAGTVLATFDTTAGAQKVTLGAVATPGLYLDVANLRTIVGTTTPLGSAANDKFSVIGGTSYFAGNSGAAIGIRYSAADTVGWLISNDGAGANKDLLLLDDGGLEIVRIGDTSSAAQLKVTGILRVTGATLLDGNVTLGDAAADTITASATINCNQNVSVQSGTAGQVRAGALIANNTSLSGTEVIRATGVVRLDGTGAALSFAGTSQLQSTVGASGLASALPANPAGYAKVTISGFNMVFPYYNA